MVLRTFKALAVVVGIAAATAVVAAQSFGYFGPTGPTHWSELNPAWSACGNGTIQSPVDFRPPYPLQSGQLPIEYGDTTGEIINNGHTIEVETEGAHNTLTLGGVVYELVQFHFHP
jgi:carbonic anhydrase